MADRIAGLTIGGVAVTVADCGAGLILGMSSRALGQVEAALSVDQSARLRRLLHAAEKRAKSDG